MNITLKKILYVICSAIIYSLVTVSLGLAGIQLGAVPTILLLIPIFMLYKIIFSKKSESTEIQTEIKENPEEKILRLFEDYLQPENMSSKVITTNNKYITSMEAPISFCLNVENKPIEVWCVTIGNTVITDFKTSKWSGSKTITVTPKSTGSTLLIFKDNNLKSCPVLITVSNNNLDDKDITPEEIKSNELQSGVHAVVKSENTTDETKKNTKLSTNSVLPTTVTQIQDKEQKETLFSVIRNYCIKKINEKKLLKVKKTQSDVPADHITTSTKDISPLLNTNTNSEETKTDRKLPVKTVIISILSVCLVVSVIITIWLGVTKNNQIAALNKEIQTLNASLTELKEDNESLKELKTDYQETIRELRDKIVDLNKTLSFYNKHAVCVNENSRLYHKYGCWRFDDSSFWIYNTENAEYKGYRPCSQCCY